MKIIQLVQKPQLRGAEIFACQLSNHLVEQGHEVIVVSIFPGDAKLPFKGKIIELNRPLSRRFTDVKGWAKFTGIIKKFQPDIIQANAGDTVKFAVSSQLIFRWKTPIIFRNANKISDFVDSRLKWKLNSFYLSKVSYVISVSKECEKDFLKTFQYPESGIRTVQIGVEEKEVGGIPEDLQPIFLKGPVLTHIGGFVPEKNHAGLISIFSRLVKKEPRLQLILIGKGKLEEKINQQINEFSIRENVHFLHYRKDVLEIIKASNVFVLPSLIEGLPAVILEAMYCTTPVVAYDVGGISEVVINEKTGWLVQKSDEKKFIRSVEEVLNHDRHVQRKIAAAKSLIDDRFMNDIIAKRFSQCYKKILN